jgi:hypothetical protein
MMRPMVMGTIRSSAMKVKLRRYRRAVEGLSIDMKT